MPDRRTQTSVYLTVARILQPARRSAAHRKRSIAIALKRREYSARHATLKYRRSANLKDWYFTALVCNRFSHLLHICHHALLTAGSGVPVEAKSNGTSLASTSELQNGHGKHPSITSLSSQVSTSSAEITALLPQQAKWHESCLHDCFKRCLLFRKADSLWLKWLLRELS